MVSFENQVVIVTGAGGGIGRHYALDIARRGGAVVVNDLGGTVEGIDGSPDMADSVVAEIRDAGGKAVANSDSVTSEQGAKRIVEVALDSFGRVDALINNAGNMRNSPFDQSALSDLESMIAVHLFGSYNLTKEVWPYMKAQHYGRIVFTTSSAGMFGNATQSGYAAAKSAVTGLMNVTALEGEEHGILCNGLMPNAMSRMALKMAEEMDMEQHAREAPFFSEMKNAMDPVFNTGIGVFLASSACKSNHSLYSCCAGRIARVFVGATEGWHGSREFPATADDIEANFGQICDLNSGIHIPATPMDENRIVLTRAEPSLQGAG